MVRYDVIGARKFSGTPYEALKSLHANGFEPLSMQNEVRRHVVLQGSTLLRIKLKQEHVSEDYGKFSTQSIRAVGKTRAGNLVAVYAHMPNYLSMSPEVGETADEVEPWGEKTQARTSNYPELVQGAVPLQEWYFRSLVDLDGLKNQQGERLLWVVDLPKLIGAPTYMSLYDSLQHPEFVPFIGDRQIAEQFISYQGSLDYMNGIKIPFEHPLSSSPTAVFLKLKVGDRTIGLRTARADEKTDFIGIPKGSLPKEPSLEERLRVA